MLKYFKNTVWLIFFVITILGCTKNDSNNYIPIANAGIAQDGFVGTEVRLDGSASSDANQQALTYTWSLLNKPDESSIKLNEDNNVSITFVPDVIGKYKFQLIVNDSIDDSEASYITVTVYEHDLIASAGGDQIKGIDSIVTLDASKSQDYKTRELNYFWEFVKKPFFSRAEFSDAKSVSPEFTPDEAGEYLIQLTVNNGEKSVSDLIQIEVVPYTPPILEPAFLRVKENSTSGLVIGVIPIIQIGDGEIQSIDLLGDGSKNFIISTTGEVMVSSSAHLNYETQNVYNVKAIARNNLGESAPVDIVIRLENVIDILPIIEGGVFSINDNTSALSVVGSVNILDIGESPVSSMILSGLGSEDFSISKEGVITVAANTVLDYTQQNIYKFKVQAISLAGLSSAVNVDIILTTAGIASCTNEFYSNTIDVLVNKCKTCHISSGIAKNSKLIFTDSLSDNEMILSEYMRSNSNKIIEKNDGTLNHGGGQALNDSELQFMKKFEIYQDNNAMCIIDKLPVIEALSIEIPESITSGIDLGKVNIISHGESAIQKIALSGENSNIFKVSNSGVVQLATGKHLDYEERKTYNLNMSAYNLEGESQVVPLLITILDVNDTVPILEDGSFSVDENTLPPLELGRVNIINTGDSPISHFALKGEGKEAFVIDKNGTLSLSVDAKLDYELAKSYTFLLNATNSAGQSMDVELLILVNDLNDTTVIGNTPVLEAVTLQLEENSPSNSVVGKIPIVNIGDSAIREIKLFGLGSSKFLVSNDGEITLNNTGVDFEDKEFYALQAVATNDEGNSQAVNVRINIKNILDTVPMLAPFHADVLENIIGGSTIGSIDILDYGEGSFAGFKLIGVDSDKFLISSSGEVTLAPNAVLDYEDRAQYKLSLSAKNSSGESSAVSFFIDVSNIADTPPILGPLVVNISEVEKEGFLLGMIPILSIGEGNINSIVLSGDGSNDFTVSGTGSLSVSIGTTLNYSNQSEYNLEAIASNVSGNSSPVSIKIQVTQADMLSCIDQYFRDVVEPHLTACKACHVVNQAAQDTRLIFENNTTKDQVILYDFMQAHQNLAIQKNNGVLNHVGGKALSEEGIDIFKTFKTFSANSALCALPKDNQLETLSPSFITLLDANQTAEKINRNIFSTGITPNVNVQTDAELNRYLDEMLASEDFYMWLRFKFNDLLQTDEFATGSLGSIPYMDDGSGNSSRTWYERESTNGTDKYNYLREGTRYGVKRAAIELMIHVIKNERPLGEIVSADYMLVNPFSARAWDFGNETYYPDQSIMENFIYVDGGDYTKYSKYDFREVHRKDYTTMPGSVIDIPHAGIMSDMIFLKKYPTTVTNRNRHRTNTITQLFLGFNIENIAIRSSGDLGSDNNFTNPTTQNPSCTVCHYVMDPIAGAFQNYSQYESILYRPRRDKIGWYDIDEQDMFTTGYSMIDSIPDENRSNALQWLGSKIATDERFYHRMLDHFYKAFTGKDFLDKPLADDNNYKEKLQAYNLQEKIIAPIIANFKNSGNNPKVMIKELLTSPLYRSVSIDTSIHSIDLDAFIDFASLLTPEFMSDRINNTLGHYWQTSRNTWDSKEGNILEKDFLLLYGGIDNATENVRSQEMDGLKAAIQKRIAYDTSCMMLTQDLFFPLGEVSKKTLTPFVNDSTTPTNSTDIAKIKHNIQYLQNRLHGTQLNIDDVEIEATYALLLDLYSGFAAANDTSLPCGSIDQSYNGVRYRLFSDVNYMYKTWQLVLNYLINDYYYYFDLNKGD